MNFSHFKEYLESDFKIKISLSALRNLLIKAGFVSKKSRRHKKHMRKHR